jgi:tRNA(Ile)-lysidine synthase
MADRRSPYPKPGPLGGKLIRGAIAFLREQGISLPIDSHIHIACSGGSDSVALAWLVARYGRRIARPDRVRLLHVNHGWRGEESDGDEAFVRKLAERLGVPVTVRRAAARATGRSPEEAARTERKAFFRHELALRPGFVLTAHHAEDLAETVLWRLLTGASADQGAGILPRHGFELRPLLRTRKADLRAFLAEEGVTWREDRTNSEPRLLRSRLRLEVMPRLEALFPRSIEHLAEAALGRKAPRSLVQPALSELAGALARLSGQTLRLRRAQLELLQEKLSDPAWEGEVQLPRGWVLKHVPEPSRGSRRPEPAPVGSAETRSRNGRRTEPRARDERAAGRARGELSR